MSLRNKYNLALTCSLMLSNLQDRVFQTRGPMDSHMGSIQFVQLELGQIHPEGLADLLPHQGEIA